MNKDDFLAILSKSTPEELNKYIINKGVKPKVYCPVTIIKNNIGGNKDARKFK